MKTFTLTDVYGTQHVVTSEMVLVTANDKHLSGWGRAEGKISKRVVICENWTQADRVARNMESQGFVYIHERSARLGMPYYSPSRYVVSVNHVNDCPIWNR